MKNCAIVTLLFLAFAKADPQHQDELTTRSRNPHNTPGTTTKSWIPKPYSRFDDRNQIVKTLTFNNDVSDRIEQFSLELFVNFLSDPDLQNSNFMISPFSIYHILSMIMEGAEGSTFEEIKTFLKAKDLPSNKDFLQYLNHHLNVTNSAAYLQKFALLVRDKNRPLKNEYENLLTNTYDATIEDVEFRNIEETLNTINQLVSEKTNGQITNAVIPDDLYRAQLIMISGLHYKGQWKNKFNRSDTFQSQFRDSNGKSIGNVEMMFQSSPIAYSTIKDIGSYVIEMEYADPPLANRAGEFGKGMSMFVILPKKGQNLTKTAKDLYQFTMNKVYRELYNSKVNYGDEDVEVYVPKFEALTDLDIKTSLEKYGLKEIFKTSANLNKINPNYYISAMVHKTKITVDEEGTEASAITSGIFSNKSTPPKFLADRPFLYFIVEKYSNLILFAGQYVGPGK